MSRARDLANVADDVSTGTVVTTASPSLGRRNLIINGAMQVAQRSTSETGVTSNNYHTLDRYRLTASGATYSTSQQSLTAGQTDIPSQFKYFQRFNPTTANNNCGVSNRIEDVTVVSGEIVTFSLYAKGTNPAGGELDLRLSQNFGSGGSPAVYTTVGTLTLTSSWQRFTYTVSVPSISGKTVGTNSYLELKIFQPDDDTGTSAFTFDSTGWQLEVGSVATPFEHRSFGEELALCQRYCFRMNSNRIASGTVGSSTEAFFVTHLPVSMRATPSLIVNALGNIVKEGTAWYANTAISVSGSGTSPLALSTTQSNNQMSALHSTALGNGVDLTFDAEL